MLNIVKLEKITLTEYLQGDLNKEIYNFYYEFLKPNYNIEIEKIEDFFYSIYQEVKIFIDNYETIPYETNNYFERKIKATKSKEAVLVAIKYTLMDFIIELLIYNIVRDENGKLEVLENRYFRESEKQWGYRMALNFELFAVAEKELSYPEPYKGWFLDIVIDKMYSYIERSEYGYGLKPKKILEFKRFVETKIFLEEKNNFNIDLSNSKGTEKIIMLHELGVLDFLRQKEPFNLSTNVLATVLSTVTGEKTETLQSYINPIINSNSGQKNNPLKNIKNVEKIKQTLINLGFKQS